MTIAPPGTCCGPKPSPRISQANMVAAIGCTSRVTEENEAGRCASSQAIRPWPPTWQITASAARMAQECASRGHHGSPVSRVMSSSTAAVLAELRSITSNANGARVPGGVGTGWNAAVFAHTKMN